MVNLTSYFKVNAAPGKGIKSIVEFIKQGKLTVKVTEVLSNDIRDFILGATLTVKIIIVTITFATKYTLKLV
ncbi:hypothetical protein [Spiroplasma endosymbiont of Nebria brevicollis]|uniref:hypothetical protein n=1 Tax=Spiroplasma endosymbiont of Nebria brevicollis TaxID=3066284 RepID=UPI00313B0A99